MAKTDFTFTLDASNRYVSDIIAVNSIPCVHIEKKFGGSITIRQRTTGDTDTSDTTVNFDDTFVTNGFSGIKEFDIPGYVFPKQFQLVLDVPKSYNAKVGTSSDHVTGFYITE